MFTVSYINRECWEVSQKNPLLTEMSSTALWYSLKLKV